MSETMSYLIITSYSRFWVRALVWSTQRL